jgi:hypothetical protein
MKSGWLRHQFHLNFLPNINFVGRPAGAMPPKAEVSSQHWPALETAFTLTLQSEYLIATQHDLTR